MNIETDEWKERNKYNSTNRSMLSDINDEITDVLYLRTYLISLTNI